MIKQNTTGVVAYYDTKNMLFGWWQPHHPNTEQATMVKGAKLQAHKWLRSRGIRVELWHVSTIPVAHPDVNGLPMYCHNFEVLDLFKTFYKIQP